MSIHHVWVKVITLQYKKLTYSRANQVIKIRRINTATIVVNVSDSRYIFAGIAQSSGWCRVKSLHRNQRVRFVARASWENFLACTRDLTNTAFSYIYKIKASETCETCFAKKTCTNAHGSYICMFTFGRTNTHLEQLITHWN